MQATELNETFNISLLPPFAKKELLDFYDYLLSKYSTITEKKNQMSGLSAEYLLKKGSVCAIGGDAVAECEALY